LDNRPEAERAVIHLLVSETGEAYPYVELGNGNKAKFLKLNKENVPYYEEEKRKGLFN